MTANQKTNRSFRAGSYRPCRARLYSSSERSLWRISRWADGSTPCPQIIPGLPKDMVCYLFGISPMPLWVFALVSTLGRIPGTWVLSAQGAHTAAGNYLQVILLTTIVVAVALPLYYYRTQIIRWFQGKSVQPDDRGD